MFAWKLHFALTARDLIGVNVSRTLIVQILNICVQVLVLKKKENTVGLCQKPLLKFRPTFTAFGQSCGKFFTHILITLHLSSPAFQTICTGTRLSFQNYLKDSRHNTLYTISEKDGTQRTLFVKESTADMPAIHTKTDDIALIEQKELLVANGRCKQALHVYVATCNYSDHF